MKTINFLTSHFIPENTACTNRVLSFVRELEKTYKVNVISLTEKGELRESLKVVYSDDITIFYVNQKYFNGKNFFIRAFNEIMYIKKLINVSKKYKCDMTIVTSPYMFMIPLVGFTVKSPKLLDIRDLVWEYLDEKSFLKKRIKSVLKYIMKKGFSRFDHITVTNAYEAQVLKDMYHVENIDILYNGIEKSRFDTFSNIKLTEKIPFTVTYVGNMGLAQNIYTLVKAAKLLPDVNFLLIGTGIELEDIKQYVESNNIKNVKILGKIAWNELSKYYEKTSVLYAQLDEKYISAVPSKLYEYASIGLPILYAGVGQAVELVKKFENAKTIPPNNVAELVNAIESMKENGRSVSEKNRLLIHDKYLRESAAQDIVKISKRLLNTKNNEVQ